MVKTFALIFGIAYLLAGIAGFIPGAVIHTHDMPPLAVEAAHGRLFGLLPVNALHSIVHILTGATAILASRTFNGARVFCQAIAVVYGLLAVMGLIPGLNTMFGLVPIYGHDVWFHALSALVAGYFGFVAPRHDANRQTA